MIWLAQNWIWIVFAAGILLLMGRRRRGGHAGNYDHFHSGGEQGANWESRPIDPVSGELVDSTSAPNSTYQGRLYFFSSKENREKFESSPAQYARAGGGPDSGHHHHRHGC